jgi:endoplasmic reticulum Man9GlcNAc2 1,2-alpha-mannosidase
MYLHHAVDLADRLMAAFESPTGLPWSLINLGKRQGIPDKDNNRWASLAEVGTLALEFKYLSHLTGDMTYWRKVETVSRREAIKALVTADIL